MKSEDILNQDAPRDNSLGFGAQAALRGFYARKS